MAALATSENPDLTVTILEKSPEVGGNTSLSTGMVPAAGTRFQREAGIEETPEDMAQDILEKNGYEADEEMVRHLCEESANLVHWLVDDWDISLSLVDDFRYPKHSEYRMHAPPGRNGANLVSELRERIEATANVELLTNAPVQKLVADDGAVVGVVAGDRRTESIAAGKVILATDGFGGNREMLTEWTADIEDAHLLWRGREYRRRHPMGRSARRRARVHGCLSRPCDGGVRPALDLRGCDERRYPRERGRRAVRR